MYILGIFTCTFSELSHVHFRNYHMYILGIITCTFKELLHVHFRVWNKVSESGRYRAVVRKVTDKKKDEKHYIEVYYVIYI